ncbi:MAG: Hypothetical protein BHV28_16620 [Candidatus Tokpelaia hoelldobleri]|uniref:Lipoprotein n=1 Tax=Candidatus Tokpelaia hoelldobleri TaxID=1902579 RepID=A0A1U9JWX0_9HYPH|nr:MAG: Hypothetical protein BHV28_16620 [Candidatus Tokpelaia hoelldoblerii]
MRHPVLFSIPLAALLYGCATNPVLSPQVQNYWQARPVHELERQLGTASQIDPQGSGKKYIWTQEYTRRVTIAPGHKVAGFKMVNGRNVATTINGPAIKNLQTVSCQITATTNARNEIVEIGSHLNGLSCHSLAAKLYPPPAR